MAEYILGVDTGGTFTDLACCDIAKKRVITFKTPSTPPDFEKGVIDAVRGLAETLEISVHDLLQDCIGFIHGSTVVVNTLLTRSGSRTGLITTAGNRDLLHIAGGSWGKMLNVSWDEFRHIGMIDKPEPLIPKALIGEVEERIDCRGEVVVRVNEKRFIEVMDQLVDKGIEALAISLLWSFKNPAHEEALRKIVSSRYENLEISVSNEIAPFIGEYVRTSTTVLNAYTLKAFKKYIQTLVTDLKALGLSRSVFVMQSSGGCETAQLIQNSPVNTVGSGPVGGLVGSGYLGKLIGHKNIICTDMGGTSFEVGLVVNGSPLSKTESQVERFPLQIPSLDVYSIGSGGGSMIWVDAFGALKVGPGSAGAYPGPACYGIGGAEPTVTDADVVLGYIDPDYFMGGKMKLQKEKAYAALRVIAEKLSMDVIEVAAGACRIVDAQMADLIRRKTVGLGLDPREFVVFAYGGAGPLHGSGFTGELDVPTLIIPLGNIASCYSAFGLTATDMQRVEAKSQPAREPFDSKEIMALFNALEKKCVDALSGEGIGREDIQLVRSVDMKFIGQIWEVEVTLPDVMERDVGSILPEQFSKRYEALFGVGAAGFRNNGCEILTCRVKALGKRVKPVITTLAKTDGGKDLIKGTRKVYWESGKGFDDTPVYDGRLFSGGEVYPGPAIIEVPHTTILIHPGDRAEIDGYGNVIIHVRRSTK